MLQVITSKHPFLSLALGDFNAKNKICFDRGDTKTKGTSVNDLMVQCGLTQIIHEPIHLLDYSSSCIDPIFTSQDNLVINPLTANLTKWSNTLKEFVGKSRRIV